MVATMFSSEIDEEKMDRFLAYYEYLLSDEGKMLRLGLEGEDWQKNDDGSISLIRDENGNAPALTTKYPCIPVTHWPSWGFELQADPNVETCLLYTSGHCSRCLRGSCSIPEDFWLLPVRGCLS